MVGHDIWSELVENPFNLQNLYFGIIIILLILIGHFNHTVKMFRKDAVAADYKII